MCVACWGVSATGHGRYILYPQEGFLISGIY